MELSSLLPAYQQQYEALAPDIERGVNADLIKRGMFNSGAAADSMARAKAALLAELAGKSATTQTSVDEAAKDRAATEKLKEADRKEARRSQNMSLLGTGASSLLTLYMLNKMQNPTANILKGAAGWERFDPATGTIQAIPRQGAATAPGASTPGVVGGGGYTDIRGNWVPEIPQAAPPATMWQNATQGGAMGMAGRGLAGGLGGLLGRNLAGSFGGETGLGTDIGAGLGGLTGAMMAAKYGIPGTQITGSSPWAMGLGALAGSLGGGLLGNLFK